ncbi:MAG: tRNA (N(6)-L-threonylcarbamoyladenosine(37)-C(2))-methylthiotransferase MtaB [Acidobacteriales bacterium]|nr:tRNA (N(6)-L-threonylcarbamoyladenosine(37)-C(2))-methylthiotransferase MtaB [Terriglobales bacterium]
MASFYVQNFGCRATQADGAAIDREFRQRGLTRAQAAAEAGIVVLNTCTVTAAADQDARSAIRRIHRDNPASQIVVTGCYAQRASEEISSLAGVCQVIGNSDKHRLVDLVIPGSSAATRSTLNNEDPSPSPRGVQTLLPVSTLLQNSTQVFVSDIFAHTELLAAPVFDSSNQRTRPNLKVQDGCGNRCSFCVIPFVRGHSRSLALEKVLKAIDDLVEDGFREVVISGINLGRWGRDLNPPLRFEDLIRAILQRTSLEKLRVSSVEPMDWSDELIDIFASSSRIAKHAHVPLQSGSDRVLRAMHRKYRPWHYERKIENIKAAMPSAAIGADVMVGFPGETDFDFEATHRMIEQLPLTYLHVFTYSPRPGTPAVNLHGRVAPEVAAERNRILRELSDNKKLAFMGSFIGSTLEAITLHASDDKSSEALTDNFQKLRLPGRHPANHWVRARIEGISGGALLGVRLKSECREVCDHHA